MSGWELATRASILILLGGSLAIFAWFLVDVRRVLGPKEDSLPPDGGEGGPGARQRSRTAEGTGLAEGRSPGARAGNDGEPGAGPGTGGAEGR